MSAPSRQGSATFTIVIGAVGALIVGAIILTLVMFPIINSFTGSAIFSAETAAVANLNHYVGGLWEFWGAIILITILSFVWVSTRQ